MITTNTVFILGAGASVDFGYPTGEQLRKFIYEHMGGNTTFVRNIAQALAEWKEDIPDIEKFVIAFAKDLYHDGDYTIDAFLERFQNKYLNIGKLAIAQAIGHHENADLLYRSDNWYRILLKEMKRGATLETFPNNKVSFVTFNYDRSLEHFLFTSLRAYHERITQEQVVNIINQIPIIHLYGQIDMLPWQNPDGRPYGTRFTAHQVKQYRKNISIIFENISENIQSRFDIARNLIDQAEQVYILGFGFHKNNLERLRFDSLKNTKIMGTAYNLDNDQIRTVKDYWKSSTSLIDNGIKTISFAGKTLYNVTVYDFIKKFATLN
ncbi:MAG: hypothetical protein ACYSSI_02560 [Planctomycetota bacterium]|jgi:hypothetical protein